MAFRTWLPRDFLTVIPFCAYCLGMAMARSVLRLTAQPIFRSFAAWLWPTSTATACLTLLRSAATLGFQADGIAAADFNHDGEMDVVVGRNNNFILGDVAVFLGTGDGTFLNTANYTAGPELATGDFNHDGIMDFISEEDLFLGNGNGTFRQLKSALHASGSPYVVDLNNDGLPDVVFA